MLTVAICEDENEPREILRSRIKRYGEQAGVEFDMHFFRSGEEFLEGFAPVFDIVFMDILLPGINGLETARRMRKLDKGVLLIFVTNMRQYTIKGYEVDALNYILKPIRDESLYYTLEKALRLIRMKQNSGILVKAEGVLRNLDSREIIYIETASHYVVIHTTKEDISYYGNLKPLEEQLEKRGFYRVISYALINMRYIDSVGLNEVTLKNGTVIAISRNKKKEFLARLTAFFGEII